MPRRASPTAFVVLLTLAPSFVLADGAEVEGSGESAVIGDNVVSARKRALAAASADAVARAAAVLVGSEVAAREAGRLRSLRARAQQYLRTYRVLEEEQQGGRFLVRLAATIDERRLRRDLTAAGLVVLGARSEPAPTLTLVLREQDPLGPELAAALRSMLAREGVAFHAGPKAECAAGASCLLVSKTEEASAEEVRGVALPAARVSLQVTLQLAGKPAASKREEAWGWGEGRLAARRALERSLATAVVPLLSELRRRHPGTPRALQISGLASLPQLSSLEDALRERVPGVTACRLREVTRGMARLEVDTSLDARSLGAALEKLAPSGFSMTISANDGGTLWLTLRPAAPASNSAR